MLFISNHQGVGVIQCIISSFFWHVLPIYRRRLSFAKWMVCKARVMTPLLNFSPFNLLQRSPNYSGCIMSVSIADRERLCSHRRLLGFTVPSLHCSGISPSLRICAHTVPDHDVQGRRGSYKNRWHPSLGVYFQVPKCSPSFSRRSLLHQQLLQKSYMLAWLSRAESLAFGALPPHLGPAYLVAFSWITPLSTHQLLTSLWTKRRCVDSLSSRIGTEIARLPGQSLPYRISNGIAACQSYIFRHIHVLVGAAGPDCLWPRIQV